MSPRNINFDIPTSSRIKTFLAYEKCQQRAMASVSNASETALHAAIPDLLELERLAFKGNLKRELIKEIKRQADRLEKLSQSNGVDQQLLANIINQQRRLIEGLQALKADGEAILKENELLNSQRKRTGIQLHNSEADNTAYQHLLSRSDQIQRGVLLGWMEPLKLFSEGIETVLGLIRSSATADRELAYQGFFEAETDPDRKCQLLRISLPAECPWYPEVSMGRSRFSLRFLEPTERYEHAIQVEEDVEFGLARCGI